MRTNRALNLRTEEFECLTSYQTGSDVIMKIFYLYSQRPNLHASFYIFALAQKLTEILLKNVNLTLCPRCDLDLGVTVMKHS